MSPIQRIAVGLIHCWFALFFVVLTAELGIWPLGALPNGLMALKYFAEAVEGGDS